MHLAAATTASAAAWKELMTARVIWLPAAAVCLLQKVNTCTFDRMKIQWQSEKHYQKQMDECDAASIGKFGHWRTYSISDQKKPEAKVQDQLLLAAKAPSSIAVITYLDAAQLTLPIETYSVPEEHALSLLWLAEQVLLLMPSKLLGVDDAPLAALLRQTCLCLAVAATAGSARHHAGRCKSGNLMCCTRPSGCRSVYRIWLTCGG